VSVTNNMISNEIPFSLIDSHQYIVGMCYVILQGLRARLGIDTRVHSWNKLVLNVVIFVYQLYGIFFFFQALNFL